MYAILVRGEDAGDDDIVFEADSFRVTAHFLSGVQMGLLAEHTRKGWVRCATDDKFMSIEFFDAEDDLGFYENFEIIRASTL